MATKITTADIEEYLEGLGKKDSSKKKIYFQRVLFSIKASKNGGVKIVLDSPDHEAVLKNFKSKMIQTLTGKFKNGTLTKVQGVVKGINNDIKTPVIRLKYTDNGKGTRYVDFDVREYPDKKDERGGGTLPDTISEPATRFVLNAALESKGKIFKKQEDIFVHDVYKDLEKLYGKEWGHKLDSWINTFLQQNLIFFKHYGRTAWAKFKHMDYNDERDMQVFFMEHLQSLSTAPGVTVGRTYQQWNPADLWAVKRAEQKSLEDEITAATENPSADNLMKLNLHIIKLLEKKELVGISLKKIDKDGSYKIFNVDSSKYLTNLKSWKALDKFEMEDIRFELRNIFGNFPGKGGKGIAATTYIYFGSKYKVDATRTGTGSLIFNSQILNEKGAQGGQSPIQPLLKRLRHNKSGVTFDNKIKNYPKNADEFAEIAEDPKSPQYKLYKKWFTFTSKHSKNDYKAIKKFDDYLNNVQEAYDSRPKEGIAKLSLLHFWYDALKYHDDDPVFWTDMLYFGLKIIAKGQFGPHIKIS